MYVAALRQPHGVRHVTPFVTFRIKAAIQSTGIRLMSGRCVLIFLFFR